MLQSPRSHALDMGSTVNKMLVQSSTEKWNIEKNFRFGKESMRRMMMMLRSYDALGPHEGWQ